MAKTPTVYYGETPTYAEVVKIDTSLGTAAGTYTAAVEVPKNSYILDVVVHAVALWDAGTSATIKVGDDADDDGFYTGVNAKATDLLADESLSFAQSGGKAGAYNAGTDTHWTDRFSSSARTITMTLTTVGTAVTTGETHLIVHWARMPEASPTKVGTYVAT